MEKKRALGQYYTKHAVWLTAPVQEFIASQRFDYIVDPFVGQGDLLKPFGHYQTFGFDVDPTVGAPFNDSLVSIPAMAGGLCVTNPPYLARNSATKMGMSSDHFQANPGFADLYLIGLRNCLRAFGSVVAIVPESFLLSGQCRDRLVLVDILERNPFADTECPTLVACFGPKPSPDFRVYKDGKNIGRWSDIAAVAPTTRMGDVEINFNAVDGQIGLIGVDAVKQRRGIRFCNPAEIGEVKSTGRSLTRVRLTAPFPFSVGHVTHEANVQLERLRSMSADTLLAPFKGNNKFGERRRRLDFMMAKAIIHQSVVNCAAANDHASVEVSDVKAPTHKPSAVSGGPRWKPRDDDFGRWPVKFKHQPKERWAWAA